MFRYHSRMQNIIAKGEISYRIKYQSLSKHSEQMLLGERNFFIFIYLLPSIWMAMNGDFNSKPNKLWVDFVYQKNYDVTMSHNVTNRMISKLIKIEEVKEEEEEGNFRYHNHFDLEMLHIRRQINIIYVTQTNKLSFMFHFWLTIVIVCYRLFTYVNITHIQCTSLSAVSVYCYSFLFFPFHSLSPIRYRSKA